MAAGELLQMRRRLLAYRCVSALEPGQRPGHPLVNLFEHRGDPHVQVVELLGELRDLLAVL